MQAITIEHPDYVLEWRQADYDILMSEECAKIIQEQNIKMITWRELRDKIIELNNVTDYFGNVLFTPLSDGLISLTQKHIGTRLLWSIALFYIC